MRPQGWQTSRCRHPTRLRDARRNYLTGEIRQQCSRLKCRERTLSRSEVLWRSHQRHLVETARQPSFRQTPGGPYRFRCRRNRWSHRNRARHFRLLTAGACRRLHPRLWNVKTPLLLKTFVLIVFACKLRRLRIDMFRGRAGPVVKQDTHARWRRRGTVRGCSNLSWWTGRRRRRRSGTVRGCSNLSWWTGRRRRRSGTVRGCSNLSWWTGRRWWRRWRRRWW